MWKLPTLLLLGFAAGVLATLWWGPNRAIKPGPGFTSLEADAAPVDTERLFPPSQRNLSRAERPTLADVNALTSDFEQTLGLYELMRDMGPTDLLALLDEASIFTGADYVAATSIVIGRLAELDPEIALDRALNPPTLAQPAWIHAIFASWARLDADAAGDALDSLPVGLLAIANRGISRSTGTVPTPVANIGIFASGAIANFPSGIGTNAPISLAADVDLPSAWAEAMNIDNRQQRMQALAHIAMQWSLNDPQSALQASNSMPADGMRQAIQQQIVTRWAQSEPRAAFEWLRNAPNTRQSARMMQAAVQVLAQTNFAEAQLLVGSLDEARRDQAQVGLLGQWAQQDIEGLKSWLASQTSQRLRHEAIQQVTMHLVTQEPQAAQAWLAELADAEAAMGTAIAVVMLANTDINRAAEFIDAIDQPEARANAAQSLIQQWSRFSPNDAASWIENQAGDQRPSLYRSLTQAWGSNAPEDALAFAEGLLDGERDYALLGVLPYLPEDQRQPIVEQIQDGEVRDQAAEQFTIRASRR